MPRNRKQSQKSRTASPEKHVRDVKGGFGMNELDDKWSDDIFTYVQEMFTGQVDPDVIHMVLSESEWRGNLGNKPSKLKIVLKSCKLTNTTSHSVLKLTLK